MTNENISAAPDNPYTVKEKAFYDADAVAMAKDDHRHHDANPDYKEFFINPFTKRKSKLAPENKLALDLGCGTGRNVSNLLKTKKFSRVDGVDISCKVLEQASLKLTNEGYTKGVDFELFENNGVALDCLEENFYSHAMSTIALQHIPVYDIRFKLLSGLYRCLKSKGTLVFQMGFGAGYGKSLYKDICYAPEGFNTKHDVEVMDRDEIIDDLKLIGFKDIECFIRDSFSDGHPKWIFVKCRK